MWMGGRFELRFLFWFVVIRVNSINFNLMSVILKVFFLDIVI